MPGYPSSFIVHLHKKFGYRIMNTVALAVLGYVGGTFLLSALMVRFLPGNFSSRRVRKHLILFPVLPLLLVVDAVHLCETVFRHGSGALRATFELVSGRQLHASRAEFYSYGRSRSGSSRRASIGSRHARKGARRASRHAG